MINSEIYYKSLQKKYSRSISLGLSRINKALKLMGNPHLNMQNCINILGSDGKFTCLESVSSFLKANKNTTTKFISPHLVFLQSRIWLKNRFISLSEIKKYERKISKLKVKLSLFEMLTLVYVLAASKTKAEYNCIESGLLFAKDSTRLWNKPLLQACVNLNKQHLEWVYPKTINEICRQKVGYMSDNTNIYIGKQKPKVLRIVKKILKKNNSNIIYPSTWKIVKKNKKFFYKDKKNLIKINSKYIYSKGLIDNLGLAIKIALDLNIKPKIIERTIPSIKYEGRLDYIKSGKLRKYLNKNQDLLLDGAHSNTSAKNLYNYLKSLKKPVYGIWAMQKNKMPKQFLKNFKGIFKKITTMKIKNEPNSCTAEELKKIAFKQGYLADKAENIQDALKRLKSNKVKTICVFGSLYHVGNVISKN
tara:strand:+ start:1338 stop:2594 length:1257 start_codon:yes stop_codon:yes gene_type:complete